MFLNTKISKIVILTLMVLVVGLSFALMYNTLLSIDTPSSRIITQRSCDFIDVNSDRVAMCNDGTSWSVSPLEIVGVEGVTQAP